MSLYGLVGRLRAEISNLRKEVCKWQAENCRLREEKRKAEEEHKAKEERLKEEIKGLEERNKAVQEALKRAEEHIQTQARARARSSTIKGALEEVEASRLDGAEQRRIQQRRPRHRTAQGEPVKSAAARRSAAATRRSGFDASRCSRRSSRPSRSDSPERRCGPMRSFEGCTGMLHRRRRRRPRRLGRRRLSVRRNRRRRRLLRRLRRLLHRPGARTGPQPRRPRRRPHRPLLPTPEPRRRRPRRHPRRTQQHRPPLPRLHLGSRRPAGAAAARRANRHGAQGGGVAARRGVAPRPPRLRPQPALHVLQRPPSREVPFAPAGGGGGGTGSALIRGGDGATDEDIVLSLDLVYLQPVQSNGLHFQAGFSAAAASPNP